MAVDAALVFAAYAAALLLRFDGSVPLESWSLYAKVVPGIAVAHLVANFLLHVYRTAWRYGGAKDVLNLAVAILLVTAVVMVVNYLSPGSRPIPLSVNLIAAPFLFLGMVALKLQARVVLRQVLVSSQDRPGVKRLLVVGAGDVGQFVARQYFSNFRLRHRPVCFVDDDPQKRGARIHGIPVLGDRYNIPALVEKYKIDVIAIAFASRGSNFRELLVICQGTGASVRIVPGFGAILDGEPGLREVTVEDLLSRDPIQIDYRQCLHSVNGKVVLVTGAAGSIGSELCHQVLGFEPSALHLMDNNETGLHDLSLALNAVGSSSPRVKAWTGDVADSSRVGRVIQSVRPQVVFHAAAYKHVPLMEEHPDEAFRVNVRGTLNMCHAAEEAEVERFVFISTDKAVQPVSVMGATKRLCEQIVGAMSLRGRTVFCAVRFGNVIGSRGSVVPLFWKQIERGGPVSVTHPEATRYFMTVPEAARLIVQAAAFAEQGQTLMLDMGDAMGIVDLARKMIKMRGLSPEEIRIVYTGLRPGDKVREDLTGDSERLTATSHPDVLLVDRQQQERSIEQLEGEISKVEEQLSGSPSGVAQAIYRLVQIERPSATVDVRAGSVD